MEDYDNFSDDYDKFVNWPSRLAVEIPFITAQIGATASRILDVACGTGMHAIALAQNGYQLAAADISPGMVKQARRNAAKASVGVDFAVAGFGTLSATFPGEHFSAVLCLGNSLPHLLSPQALEEALTDFSACLQPGGLLIIQNRNFDAVVSRKERWMAPQAYQQGEFENIFIRFYDFNPDGMITFNILSLRRAGHSTWTQNITTTRLRPLTQAVLLSACVNVGFGAIQSYGNLTGDPFDPTSSSNLVLTARKI